MSADWFEGKDCGWSSSGHFKRLTTIHMQGPTPRMAQGNEEEPTTTTIFNPGRPVTMAFVAGRTRCHTNDGCLWTLVTTAPQRLATTKRFPMTASTQQ